LTKVRGKILPQPEGSAAKCDNLRSRIMACVRSTNTKPEILVRRILHSLGYRYRTHNRKLPGTPDIVLTKRRKAIFVHGCFWHRHNCKRGSSTPQSNRKYWIAKFTRNRERDSLNRRSLNKLGWNVLVIWECWIARPEFIKRKPIQYLQS